VPLGAHAGEVVHPLPEPDAGSKAEHIRVPVQIREDVMVRQEGKVAIVIEVAEGRQHPTGVGVHGRPHSASAELSGPLAAQFQALLEDRRLEAL
jgi:hypothetical protein